MRWRTSRIDFALVALGVCPALDTKGRQSIHALGQGTHLTIQTSHTDPWAGALPGLLASRCGSHGVRGMHQVTASYSASLARADLHMLKQLARGTPTRPGVFHVEQQRADAGSDEMPLRIPERPASRQSAHALRTNIAAEDACSGDPARRSFAAGEQRHPCTLFHVEHAVRANRLARPPRLAGRMPGSPMMAARR